MNITIYVTLFCTVSVCVFLTIMLNVFFTRPSQIVQSRTLTFQEIWQQFELVETIISTGKTLEDNLQPGDQFGTLSINSDATILAVGAAYENGIADITPSVGAVYISICNPSSCKQVFMVRGENVADHFGETVVVSNSRVLIVSWEALYIYISVETCSDTWKLEHKVLIDQTEDIVKYNVVACGDDAFVLYSEKGHIQVFRFSDNKWKLTNRHNIKHGIISLDCDKNGHWLALLTDSNKLEIYTIHKKFKSNHNFELKVTPDNVHFSQNGQSMVIGCPHANDMSGVVIMFEIVDRTWYRKSDYKLDNSLPGDCFGYSVLSPNGHILAVGAPTQVNNLPTNTVYGSIYFFMRKHLNEDFQLSQKIVYPGIRDSRWNMFGVHMEFSDDGDVFFASATGCGDIHSQGGAVFKYHLV
jgi:hypothetical protein